MPRSQPKADTANVPGPSNSPSTHARRSAHPLRDHVLLQMADQAGYIHDSHQAHEALEMLVTPTGAADREVLELDRSQLGAILRVLNAHTRKEIQAMMNMAEAARGVA